MGVCDTIRFQIVDQISIGVVSAIVTAVPSGFTVCDVPGLEIPNCTPGIAGPITVYDPIGCFFNEPSNFFPGRQGWAKYMQAVFPSIPDTGLGTYYQPQWEVFSLCCNSGGCQ